MVLPMESARTTIAYTVLYICNRQMLIQTIILTSLMDLENYPEPNNECTVTKMMFFKFVITDTHSPDTAVK